MSLNAFTEALRLLAGKLYIGTIERMTGKRINMLHKTERSAANEAALEVFVQLLLKPFVEQKLQAPGLNGTMDRHLLILKQPPIIQHLQSQLKTLGAIFSHYRSQNTSKRNDGLGLTLKEMNKMLIDFRVLPKLIDGAHVDALWLYITSRDVSSADGASGLQLSISSSSPQPRGAVAIPQTVGSRLGLKPTNDALSFNQFVELIGHIGLETMPQTSALERITAVCHWLNQSEGNFSILRAREQSQVKDMPKWMKGT